MKLEEQLKSKITFLNKPKLSAHEADSKFNARRLELIPHVKNYISKHEKFKGKEVRVTIAEKGVSSLVCIIETSKEKIVLKIHLSITDANGEAQFLETWERAGVKVPHVIEEGLINGHEYTLMEFIDARPLNEVYKKGEIVKREIYVELGSILRAMHEPKVEGYGRVVNGKAEFLKFDDWIHDEDVQKKFRYVQEHKLLGDEHGSLDVALRVLTEYADRENRSSYCHNDFGTANIFATDPLTIFDPRPRFNNAYFDLGTSIMMTIANDNGLLRAKEQLVKGYFKGEPYDEKVLHASILLNAYMKFPYSHKIKNLERMRNVQEYLIKNKQILD
ncbi:MAG: aminoglycoside phosphotransferase family protein [Candidatus Nomurabacteria bacterium]|nr:aminoglycoside phosphotransferase family protein [Candidatus Nomurabacteria bacterium]